MLKWHYSIRWVIRDAFSKQNLYHKSGKLKCFWDCYRKKSRQQKSVQVLTILGARMKTQADFRIVLVCLLMLALQRNLENWSIRFPIAMTAKQSVILVPPFDLSLFFTNYQFSTYLHNHAPGFITIVYIQDNLHHL